MPPKRDAAQLRALADDPAVGWLQTPVASHTEVGLPKDYLSVFLKHHNMPVVTTESLEQRSYRLAGRLSTAERAAHDVHHGVI